jgi:glycosyltransferase involved in cell wall biosynthesis
MNNEKILVIVPCYNEEESIGGILDDLINLKKSNGLNMNILVIDDSSQDQTYEIAVSKAKCVQLSQNLGIGGAVQTGIRYAYWHQYDYCVQIDGDGQHAVSDLLKLFQCQNETKANIVIGSRFLSKQGYQSTWARRIGITCISWVLSFLYGKKISDPTSGLRLLDTVAIKLFTEGYPQDYPEPISNGIGVKSGLVINEVEVNMKQRENGKSSISGIQSIIYMIRVVGLLIIYKIGGIHLCQQHR